MFKIIEFNNFTPYIKSITIFFRDHFNNLMNTQSFVVISFMTSLLIFLYIKVYDDNDVRNDCKHILL